MISLSFAFLKYTYIIFDKDKSNGFKWCSKLFFSFHIRIIYKIIAWQKKLTERGKGGGCETIVFLFWTLFKVSFNCCWCYQWTSWDPGPMRWECTPSGPTGQRRLASLPPSNSHHRTIGRQIHRQRSFLIGSSWQSNISYCIRINILNLIFCN